jgi:mRNA interferase MazF
MPFKRGEVVLVLFPDSNLRTAKRRPALIIQADSLATGMAQTIIAMITSNMRRAGHPSRVTLEQHSAQGIQAGILMDSVIMTDNLATIRETEIDQGHRRPSRHGRSKQRLATYARTLIGNTMRMSDEIRLLDVVALLEDVPSEGLSRGEVGTVVEIFADKPDLPGAFLVEFSDRNGESYAFAHLHPQQLVKLRYRDATRDAA